MGRLPAHSRPLPTTSSILDEFFWPHVDRSGGPDACWPWLRSCISSGYGQISNRALNGRWTTHALAYRSKHGEVPEGHFLDHTCHNLDLSCPGGKDCPHRRCCNPAHLEAVTNASNLDRANSARGRGRFTTHCPQGHEYTDDNVMWIERRGGRERFCKACNRHKVWCAKWGHKWPASDSDMAERGYRPRNS